MAIAYRSHTTGSLGSNSLVLSVNKPSGLADGDLLVCFVSSNTNTLITPPRGEGWRSAFSQFTGTQTHVNTTTALSTETFWKYIDDASSEPSAYLIHHSENAHMSVICMAFSGANEDQPFMRIESNSESTTNPTCPALDNTTVGNIDGACLVLRLTAYDDGTAQDTDVATTPTSHTLIANTRSANSTSGCGAIASYLTTNPSSAGSVASADHEITQSEESISFTMALTDPGVGYITHCERNFTNRGLVRGWLEDGETCVLRGANFLGIGANDVIIGNAAIYNDVTTEVVQSTVSSSSTTISFTADIDTFSADTTYYAFYRNSFLGVATARGVPVIFKTSEPDVPDVWTHTGTFTCPSGGGSVDVNVDVTGLPADPVAVVCWGTAVEDTTGASGAVLFYGFTEFESATPVGKSMFLVSEGDANDNDAKTTDFPLAIGLPDSSTITIWQADSATQLTNGFRFHFNLAGTEEIIVNYMAFCGTDVRASIADHDDQEAPTTSFAPDTMFFMGGTGTTWPDAGETQGMQSFGVATVNGDYPLFHDIDQFCTVYWAGSNTATTTRRGLVFRESCLAQMYGSTMGSQMAVRWMNPASAGGGLMAGSETDDRTILSLSLGGPLVKRSAGTFGRGTGSSYTFDDLGGTMDAIFVIATRNSLDDVGGTGTTQLSNSENGICISVGVSDTDGNQHCSVATLVNAATNTAMIHHNDRIMATTSDADASTTNEVEGEIAAFDGDATPTITFSPNEDTTDYKNGFFAIERVNEVAGASTPVFMHHYRQQRNR